MNSYSPLALVSVVASKIAIGVEQVDAHAFEQHLRIVEVAIRSGVGVDPAADRAGRLLAEVVLNRVDAGRDVDAGEDAEHTGDVVRVSRRRCRPARRRRSSRSADVREPGKSPAQGR